MNVDPVTGEVMSSSKEKPVPKHPKTVRALQAEQSTTWSVVDAMVDEFEFSNDGFRDGELAELANELRDVGVEKHTSTVNIYAHAARLVATASANDRTVLRSCRSPLALGKVGSAGMSPEAVAAEIRTCPNFGLNRAKAVVAELTAAKRAAAGIPQRPVDYDAKIQSACSAIIDTLAAVRDGAADLDAMTWMYVHTTARAMQSSVTDDYSNVTVEVDSGLAAIEQFLATNG